jgi:uncharacterized membrane protein YgcG
MFYSLYAYVYTNVVLQTARAAPGSASASSSRTDDIARPQQSEHCIMCVVVVIIIIIIICLGGVAVSGMEILSSRVKTSLSEAIMAPKVCKRPAAKGWCRMRSTRPPGHSGARPPCSKALALAEAEARAVRAEAAAASAQATADRAEAAAEVMGEQLVKAAAEVAALAKLTGKKLGKDAKGGSGSGNGNGNGSGSGSGNDNGSGGGSPQELKTQLAAEQKRAGGH